jgi:8-oxo-dGTP pyrophosphatase MutT (NUDIX family)
MVFLCFISIKIHEMTAAAAATGRVLVHLQKSMSSAPVPAPFSESIVDFLGGGDGVREKGDLDTIQVQCRLEENILILQGADGKNPHGRPLRRPPQCPIKLLSPTQKEQLPVDVTSRGVAVGAVAVVESKDRCVLLTRRAAHMRTFPGVWVPPGGAPDPGESLLEAALRELKEEVGLVVLPSEVASDVLCLWESVYPPFLERGPPKRHHVVVYFHLRLIETHQVLDEKIVLDPEEVDACAWLSVEQAAALTGAARGAAVDPTQSIVVRTLENGRLKEKSRPMATLAAKPPVTGVDVERVSSGTLFAVEEWLKQTCEEPSA